MSELQTITLFLGACLFILALVNLALAMTVIEMKQRLNSLWRWRRAKLDADREAQHTNLANP